MKFFNRAWNDSYDELITFYPRFYQDVYEMTVILHAHGDLTDEMMDDIEQTYLDAFIDTASEQQIARWENFLHISLNRSLTLDARRRAVKAYIIGFGKMSASVIKAIVNTYLDVTDTDVDFIPIDEEGNNAVLISIFADDDISANFQPLRDLLRRKIPAHLWYWYRQIIHYLINNREIMDLAFSRIRFATGMDFWETHRHDGRFYHDGTIRHRIWRRYNLMLRIGSVAGTFYTPEELRLARAIYGAKWGISEKASSDKVRNHTRMLFWYDYDGQDPTAIQMHNGAVLHNGEIYHGLKRRYNLRLLMSGISGRIKTDEDVGFPAVRFIAGMDVAEGIAASLLSHYGLDFWGLQYHDGVMLHDGRHIHGRERGKIRANAGFLTAAAIGTETIGEASVLTRTHEVYFHNGEYTHNRRARHKTIYKKEVAQ